MKRIAIYSRKSKETDTGESIKTQIELCKFYFDKQYEKCTYEIFEDEGFSGGNIDRPSFKRMMILAKHKQFDIVAVYKIDRIARNIVDFMNIFSDLEKNNITLVSITEGFDATTPAGRMMMTMLAGLAEMERMNIAQRVKDNMNSLAKLGRWSGGTTPTGYESELIINENGKKEYYLKLIENEAPIIEKIFTMAAEGYTTFKIGKTLNMPSKTVYSIIQNPTYAPATEEVAKYLRNIGYEIIGELNGNGFITYNRRPRVNGKKLTKGINMIAVSSKHKTPVNGPDWINANINLLSRGQEAHPRYSSYSFLSQLVKCKCGANMQVIPGRILKDGTRSVFFVCSNKRRDRSCNSKNLRVFDIETKVLAKLKEVSLDKKLLSQHVNRENNTEKYDKSIKSLNKKIGANNKIIDSLTEKLEKIDGKAFDIIVNKINTLAEDNELLKNELFIVEREKLLNTKQKVNIPTLQIQLQNMLEIFDDMPIEEKQLFIKNIIEYVQVDDDSSICLYYK